MLCRTRNGATLSEPRVCRSLKPPCSAAVELHDKDVEELVDEANTVFRTESFKAYAVNVFRRVKNKCKMTKGAMDIVEGVILQHSAGGGEAPVAVEPGAHI
jgi:hypothetical protein